MLLADPDPHARAAIRRALEPHGFCVCAEAGDAAAAVGAAATAAPELALVDVHVPGSGIRAAARISAMPGVVVVMLTSSAADDDLFDALRAGASGYLLKETALSRLPAVLHAVLNREAALPRSLVSRLVAEFQAQTGRHRLALDGRGPVKLTRREWEVLELLAHECTTAQIAKHLFISKVTVRGHLAAALKKLGVPDRQAALQLLSKAGAMR
ncbi:MAG: response regulator transcription factor [Actinomycetota bacterium]|nr:response regulator transcription factor [Actinomycetota bacterium]